MRTRHFVWHLTAYLTTQNAYQIINSHSISSLNFAAYIALYLPLEFVLTSKAISRRRRKSSDKKENNWSKQTANEKYSLEKGLSITINGKKCSGAFCSFLFLHSHFFKVHKKKLNWVTRTGKLCVCVRSLTYRERELLSVFNQWLHKFINLRQLIEWEKKSETTNNNNNNNSSDVGSSVCSH